MSQLNRFMRKLWFLYSCVVRELYRLKKKKNEIILTLCDKLMISSLHHVIKLYFINCDDYLIILKAVKLDFQINFLTISCKEMEKNMFNIMLKTGFSFLI